MSKLEVRRFLILAPIGRDADAIARILEDMGLPSAACGNLGELAARLAPETPLIVVTEEGLGGDALPLLDRLEGQPPWSDLPLLVLSAGGVRRGVDARWRLFERLGNVTLLDRPLHVGTLQGAVRSALRGRRRQFEARRYLEELEQARNDLEGRVSDRTRRLEQEMSERRQIEAALARAQRMEAIGQLTGGVAHDFNNLLQVVIGGISVLNRHGANADRRTTVLDAMRQASERGARLTQQLLAFARRQPLKPEPVDVAARVEEMGDLLRGSLRADLAFHVHLDPMLWAVKADPTQLEVAILNLVINARDATPSGGSIHLSADNVTLSLEHPVEGLVGEFVRITVEDTGSGMTEEIMRRAVEPFFTTKAPGRGTGLGLSQVYGFARQSGGDVHIDSVLGKGASVSMFVPRSHDAAPQTREPTGTARRRHEGGSILVVEDEPAVAELACQMLTELGFDCEHAADADEALQRDLGGYLGVLSDVVMPGRIDGIALARELRHLHPDLPILLTTGFAGMPERIAEAGFPVLNKPYNLYQLSEALKGALGAAVREAEGGQ